PPRDPRVPVGELPHRRRAGLRRLHLQPPPQDRARPGREGADRHRPRRRLQARSSLTSFLFDSVRFPVAAAALGYRDQAMDRESGFGGPSMAGGVLECVEACSDCYGVCMDTIEHSLVLGGAYAEGASMRLLTDCAEVVQLCESLLLRGSELSR